MTQKRVLALLAATITLSVVSTPASAILTLTDDFEAEAPGNNQTLDNWLVTVGAIDVVDNPLYGLNCNGGICIDMNGTTGVPGTIRTVATFDTGNTYNIAFDLSDSQRGDGSNDVTVTFGELDTTITLNDGDGWGSYLFTVTLDPLEQDFLQFASLNLLDTDDIGVLLDNVSVTVVPIPAALWLLGSGLLGMIGLSRRRKTALSAA